MQQAIDESRLIQIKKFISLCTELAITKQYCHYAKQTTHSMAPPLVTLLEINIPHTHEL